MADTSNCLIVLDGEINKALLRKLFFQNSPRSSFIIIASDGAANTLYKLKYTPDYIVGDLDSISSQVLSNFKKRKVEIRKSPEQQHNDFEKCVLFAGKIGCNKIIIIGFSGKRIDHTINNFSILKKYSKLSYIKFLDDSFETFFLKKKSNISYRKNEVVSISAFPKATGINTSGLKYKLKNGILEFGKREGSLNKSISNTINIEFKKGSLLIFLKHFGNLRF
jgi:thiamine pyrophosphokinase